MKIFLIFISIHLIFTIISFVINYKKATEPYYVKDAVCDFGLCFIPVLNIAYIFCVFYEKFLEKYANKVTLKFGKLSSLMKKRLK